MRNKVFLVRHLETENNRNGVLMGRSIDVDIVWDKQVEDFQKRIKSLVREYKIDKNNSIVATSPLKRCVSTAGIIRDFLGERSVALDVWEDLVETDMGDFEGKTRAFLRENASELLNKWGFSPADFKFPRGESYAHVSKRVDNIMSCLLEVNSRFIFVCTHVDIIKMFILKVQGRSFDERRSFDIPNGNVSVLNAYPRKKSFEIVSINFQLVI